MRVMTVAIGAPKDQALAAAIRDYESRITRYFSFEAVKVRPQRIPRTGDRRAIADTESSALLGRVPEGIEIVALDRRGAQWSSEELASYLKELAVLGKPGVAFLIGGPVGLSTIALERADKVLALSSLTLPHELARLVLAEQIYRSGTIQRGEPYHKAG